MIRGYDPTLAIARNANWFSFCIYMRNATCRAELTLNKTKYLLEPVPSYHKVIAFVPIDRIFDANNWLLDNKDERFPCTCDDPNCNRPPTPPSYVHWFLDEGHFDGRIQTITVNEYLHADNSHN